MRDLEGKEFLLFFLLMNCIHKVVCYSMPHISGFLRGSLVASWREWVWHFALLSLSRWTQEMLCVGSPRVMAFIIFRRGRKKEISRLENCQRKAALTMMPRGIEELWRILKTSWKLQFRKNTSKYIYFYFIRKFLHASDSTLMLTNEKH